MSATDYARYLEQEWELFVAHPDRAAVATQIEAHIGRVERVLDVGCGAGQELLPYLGRAFCVGLDMSEEGPPLARARLGSIDAGARLGVGRARAESLPIRSDQFDLVICRLVLPQTHIASALAEAARVLRPGGGYSVQFHSPLYYLRMLRRAVKGGDVPWRNHAGRVLRNGLALHLIGQQWETGGTSESFLTRARLRRMAAAVQLDLVTQIENGNPTHRICCSGVATVDAAVADALSEPELLSMLGDDLLAIVRAQRLAVVSVRRVSPLTSAAWTRAAFRLDLDAGVSMKGHRLESSAAADRAVRLGRYLPRHTFPSIVAHQGAALLSEWVDGTVLTLESMTRDDVRRVGEMMRSIHAIDIPADSPEALDRYPGASWRSELATKVSWLGTLGHLDADDRARVLDLADAHAPPDGAVRLIHGDLCPENLVVDRTGHLHVVDNDSIDFHAPEFDLARTWYRWPMRDDERRVFEESYGVRDVLDSYHQRFLHWAVVVLVGAAEFRLRQALPGADEPLGRLREALRRGTARA